MDFNRNLNQIQSPAPRMQSKALEHLLAKTVCYLALVIELLAAMQKTHRNVYAAGVMGC